MDKPSNVNSSPLVGQQSATVNDNDYSKGLYGSVSSDEIHRLKTLFKHKPVKISDITPEMEPSHLRLRARILGKRLKGNRGFIVLRQGLNTIQAIISVQPQLVSKQMLRFCCRLDHVYSIPNESIVEIEGSVARTRFPIESCTINNAEIKLDKMYLISSSTERLPLLYEDACRKEPSLESDSEFARANLDTRLDHRCIDLRTPTNIAIFTIQSAVCQFFREYLQALNFKEIHTPKLLSASSEGGANVFEVNYFKGKAYLAQSPQFYKQMMICSDYERVFEIGPVYRAENSNTHRHLTEFTGLDMEMTFSDDYTEVLDIIENLFVYIFDNLKKKFSNEIETLKAHFDLSDFKYLPKTLRLKYSEGIKMLQDDGVDINDLDDLNTENEKRLGVLIKEKYDTNFYTLDKFPLHIRPFYTMPDSEDKKLSNSYDIYMRGEEILSGSQRINDAKMLTERIKEIGIAIEPLEDYVNSFKYGAPPHAGGGIGLERVVMFYLGLSDIRYATLFPRDPRRLKP